MAELNELVQKNRAVLEKNESQCDQTNEWTLELQFQLAGRCVAVGHGTAPAKKAAAKIAAASVLEQLRGMAGTA